MKKALVTLRVGDYLPELWRLLKPFFESYAHKTRSEFIVLDQVKLTCPGGILAGAPLSAEKFQLHELTADFDVTHFVDADAFIHPDTPDIFEQAGCDKSLVLFHGLDNRLNRFAPSIYSRRSGSKAGGCTWNVLCSDWTGPDLWEPPKDFAAAVSNIQAQWCETKTGHCQREHLIDDYQTSENIARYGLKTKTIIDMVKEMGHFGSATYFWHAYNVDPYEKLKGVRRVLDEMGVAY